MKKIKKPHSRVGYARKILLGILSGIGEATFQVIDEGFLNPNYAFTGPTRALLGLDQKRWGSDRGGRTVKLRRNLFAVTLRRLQKENLVEKRGMRNLAIWRITPLGRKYFSQLSLPNKKQMIELPPKDGKVRIVGFDIPERERWKRSRLRALLVSCEYKMLQRSLWSGSRPLPEYVFEEIKDLQLRHHVHIFEISKKGSIRGLV